MSRKNRTSSPDFNDAMCRIGATLGIDQWSDIRIEIGRGEKQDYLTITIPDQIDTGRLEGILTGARGHVAPSDVLVPVDSDTLLKILRTDFAEAYFAETGLRVGAIKDNSFTLTATTQSKVSGETLLERLSGEVLVMPEAEASAARYLVQQLGLPNNTRVRFERSSDLGTGSARDLHATFVGVPEATLGAQYDARGTYRNLLDARISTNLASFTGPKPNAQMYLHDLDSAQATPGTILQKLAALGGQAAKTR